jgi:hypothetical protein
MKAQFVKQHCVPFRLGVTGGKQFVAIKNGIGASQETQGLHSIRHFLPTG